MGRIEELRERHSLDDAGLRELLESEDASLRENLSAQAREEAVERFGKGIYLRALIEWSNVCRRDCRYCGIRKSQAAVRRYTLSREEILQSCGQAWDLGVKTFVLQGGENPPAARELAATVAEIRAAWPEAAITLSLGELPFETYALLRRNGADRYLLRHETADPSLYAALHPGTSLDNRLACLQELRRLGFQTGTGMMAGVPGQTVEHLIRDIRFIEAFRPEMIGIGPFIPSPGTPLGGHPAGSADLTLRLYAILRLMCPDANIPSTTALSVLSGGGRMAGILSGANVIMPNFTPSARRDDYALYPGKGKTDISENLRRIKEELSACGYTINPVRGDYHAF